MGCAAWLVVPGEESVGVGGGSVNAEVGVPSPSVIELNTEETSSRGSPVELAGSNVLRSEVMPAKEETGSAVVCVAVLPVGAAVPCVTEVI